MVPTDPQTEQALSAVTTAINDALGADLDVFFVGDTLGICDWFVVATARNGRQLKAIADRVDEYLRDRMGLKSERVEGNSSSEWMLVDYGDFIVNIFTESAREHYQLGRLWGSANRLDGYEVLSTP